MSDTEAPDYYAVEGDVRIGRYPGRTVASYPCHWQAVADMLRRNSAKVTGPDGDLGG